MENELDYCQKYYLQQLLDVGLPEVYAWMAAKNKTIPDPIKPASPSNLLWVGFIWHDTPEGHDFWAAIVGEMEAVG